MVPDIVTCKPFTMAPDIVTCRPFTMAPDIVTCRTFTMAPDNGEEHNFKIKDIKNYASNLVWVLTRSNCLLRRY